jgi:hypothetical protein
MSTKTAISVIGAAISGAVVGVVFFFVLNNFVVINGAGLLKRQGPPWSEFYFWGLTGALIGGGGALLTGFQSRIHSREIAEAALLMDMDYRAEVSRAELGEAGQLPVFAKWYGAAHRLVGQKHGIPVQMLDYTYIEKGDEDSSFFAQTVVLLPAAGHVPAFELRPRHIGIRMLGMLGLKGIRLDAQQADPEAALVIEEFNRHYHLSLGMDKELQKLGEQIKDLEVADATVQAEEAVRRLFTLDLLEFFAQHPGWYLECNGKYLALWRRKTIVSGRDRPEFLAGALEVHNHLDEARPARRSTTVPAPFADTDPLRVPARMGGAILGLLIGFFGGALFFTDFFFLDDPFKLGGLLHLVCVGFMIVGPVVGFFFGYYVLSHPVLWWMHRRQARQRQAVADSPWQQPAGSTARVQEEDDRLIITLPARGVFRGMGFLFFWCCFWNTFMAVFSAFWLPAAWRGEVRWQGGNQIVSPVTASLFLVPFWVVGIITLVIVLRRGLRRAILVVDKDHLWLEEKTFLSLQRRDWSRGELAGVQLSPNSSPLPFSQQRDLRLIPIQGEPIPLLGWRGSKELGWLAALIRQKWQMTND